MTHRSKLGIVVLTVLAILLLTGGGLGSSARPAEADDLPAWANNAPEVFPWPLDKVITEDGHITELERPVQTRREVVEAMLTAQRQASARASSADPGAGTTEVAPTGDATIQAPVTCAVGTDWELKTTFSAEFGSVFFCSAPILKSSLDRFGFIDPVLYEFYETARWGLHYNAEALWIHTTIASIDPSDLRWCAIGSGTIYFNTPQNWFDSGCHDY